ncbi:hypothetical protein [Paenibacillus popilliae]|uniref:hypothetical protein n=1 Tax=Paenibacillus popilliae TaxID=78057 RepID=UPI00131EE91F|nr:hypothetical protein [Paenibacillus popilliae]
MGRIVIAEPGRPRILRSGRADSRGTAAKQQSSTATFSSCCPLTDRLPCSDGTATDTV